eukprot:gene7669-12135_t
MSKKQNHHKNEKKNKEKKKIEIKQTNPLTPTFEEDIDRSTPILLENTWDIYYDSGLSKGLTKEAYEQAICGQTLGSFYTIQEFWRYWNHLHLDKFPQSFNLRFFKKGVKPLWEDEENINGGKWVFQQPKKDRSQIWTDLLLLLIGEQLKSDYLICGVVFTSKPNYDMIQVWNKRIVSSKSVQKVTKKFIKLLSLDENLTINYQSHRGTIEMVLDNTLPRTHIDQPKPINQPKPVQQVQQQTVDQLKRKESRSKSPLTSLTVHKNNVWSNRSKSPTISSNTPTIGSSIIKIDETSSNASSRSTTPLSEIDWSDLPSPDRGSKSVEEITQQLKHALEKNTFEIQKQQETIMKKKKLLLILLEFLF